MAAFQLAQAPSPSHVYRPARIPASACVARSLPSSPAFLLFPGGRAWPLRVRRLASSLCRTRVPSYARQQPRLSESLMFSPCARPVPAPARVPVLAQLGRPQVSPSSVARLPCSPTRVPLSGAGRALDFPCRAARRLSDCSSSRWFSLLRSSRIAAVEFSSALLPTYACASFLLPRSVFVSVARANFLRLVLISVVSSTSPNTFVAWPCIVRLVDRVRCRALISDASHAIFGSRRLAPPSLFPSSRNKILSHQIIGRCS